MLGSLAALVAAYHENHATRWPTKVKPRTNFVSARRTSARRSPPACQRLENVDVVGAASDFDRWPITSAVPRTVSDRPGR